ncbi:zwei Ig domain protein zig-8-like isoform X3 [Biomphalaria glabrata]|uniref:Zwei Ig domain protein zig-8-like isoform X3 n=1 Tax=Biomphalaria glabrata TaxID=6526 RepID=A0A9W2ZG90_BIOGL|nr:zwei Ig domain protein zig-8-like isoform X3 [Biomphalaria glabrata]
MRVTDDIGWSPGTYTTFTVSFFGLFLWVALSTVSAARPLRYTFPTFLETPNNITAVLGSDVTLPCSVQNLGTKSVIWKKTDNLSPITIGEYVYSPDKRFSISRVDPYMDPQSRSEHHRQSHDNPRWNLQIQDVSFTHAGTYECQLSTKEDYGRNVTLHVIDRNSRGSDKKTGIKLTGTNYVEKGATIDLNCTAIAIDYTPKGVDWFKDGIRIKEGRNTLITEYWRSETNVLHSRLEVERVTMEDAGTYVCRFSHEHVESVKVIVLNSLSDLMASSRQVADSSNKRRAGTGTDGLERASSENQLGHNLGVAAVSWHWSLHLLGSFIVLVCLS